MLCKTNRSILYLSNWCNVYLWIWLTYNFEGNHEFACSHWNCINFNYSIWLRMEYDLQKFRSKLNWFFNLSSLSWYIRFQKYSSIPDNNEQTLFYFFILLNVMTSSSFWLLLVTTNKEFWLFSNQFLCSLTKSKHI